MVYLTVIEEYLVSTAEKRSTCIVSIETASAENSILGVPVGYQFKFAVVEEVAVFKPN
jgi:hypothetical protein